MKIGILSDIHEDIRSLQEVLHSIEQEHCDEIACLGDILGFDSRYYAFMPDAEECIRLITENCSVVVAGNHDLTAAGRIPEFSAGFDYPADWYDLPSEARKRIAGHHLWDYLPEEEKRTLSDRSSAFLNTLPEYTIRNYQGIPILFSHFLYPDLSGSTTKRLSRISDLWKHLGYMKTNGCRAGFAGHTHFGQLWKGARFSLSAVGEDGSIRIGQRDVFFCPPVALSRSTRGYLVFDTSSLTLKHHLL